MIVFICWLQMWTNGADSSPRERVRVPLAQVTFENISTNAAVHSLIRQSFPYSAEALFLS